VSPHRLVAVPPPPGARPGAAAAVNLVPRLSHQGYARDQVDQRRSWVEDETGAALQHVGAFSVPSEAMRGNVENPVGAAQVPLGVAGPLRVRGEHARGTFYVPLATTEGALVRSYERGMVALTRAGGAAARLSRDTNRVSPVFLFRDVESAHELAPFLAERFAEVRAEAEATTRHGRLVALECMPVGREVIVAFTFSTGDAHGMNMIVKAADRACRWIAAESGALEYLIFSGAESEKRASGALFAGGKGKRVVAGARIPRRTVRSLLQTTPERLADLWRHTVLGHLQAGALGYNGHIANGLTALFIATGQDVANVANSAVGITCFEVTAEGDLYASVTLPALTVATVGGGTGQGTARECLEMLGCAGSGRAPKLAEIAAATVLAGEISMAAAIAEGQFVEAHETYGRNRPPPSPGPSPSQAPAQPPIDPEGPWAAS
jgi:hydroxymethylglutaryl-CoA reductase (NADPH)